VLYGSLRYSHNYNLYFILIFRITALACTTLDGLLAVFLYNISYIIKAWDYE